MNEAEKIIAKKSKTAGIGVGLAQGYEAAQVMYARRGYTPDGLGLTYKNKYLKYGQNVPIDDSLVLYFTKKL